MSLGRVYLIINKENGHKYVGQTTQTVNKRWADHIAEARRMSPYPLHRALRKYGNHMFLIRELCECDVSELNEKEEYYIKQYNTFESAEGYNATSGGACAYPEGGERPTHSQETKDKLSTWAQERERTKEHNDRIKDTMIKKMDTPWGFHLKENRGDGKHLSIRILAINIDTGEEKEYESINAAAIDIKGHKKYNANIGRAANNGYQAYGYLFKKLDNKTKSIRVYGVHKKTWERTQVFESINEAARIVGCDPNTLRRSVHNKNRRSCKGYYWHKAE